MSEETVRGYVEGDPVGRDGGGLAIRQMEPICET